MSSASSSWNRTGAAIPASFPKTSQQEASKEEGRELETSREMVREPGLNLLVEGGGKGDEAGKIPPLGPVGVGGEAVQASDDSKPIFKDTAFLRPERIVLRIPRASVNTKLR
ncbi:Hypothetical protein NocV09_01900540 [Nannochloropsis oceanica]